MDDRNSRMFRRLLSVVSLDVAAELVSTGFILYAPYSFNVCRMLSNTVFYLFQALLPLLLLYYVCTLCTSRVIAPSAVLRMGIPTIALVCIILTNPFTEMLFYFDGTGYRHGRGICCCTSAPCCISRGRRSLSRCTARRSAAAISRRSSRSFALAALGIAAQAVNPEVLTTGFGLSLSILAMYLTINNPCACMDSLTGLNDKQYLLRRMDELTDAHKAFHIITVYAYQLDHMNKIAGMRGGDEFLRRAAERMQEIAGRNVFRVTGRRFLLLTFSLREYETCLTRLRELFHTQPDDTQSAPTPVILCGVVNAEKLGTSGLVLDYAEYLESLVSPERRDPGHPERPQDHGQLPLQQAGRAVPAPRDRGGSVRGLLSAGLLAPPPALRDPRGAQPPAASRAWLDLPGHLHPPRGKKEPPHHPDHRASAAARLPFSARKPGAPARASPTSRSISRRSTSSTARAAATSSASSGEYGLPCSCFQFEITETVATEYSASLTRVAESLQAAGIGLCLDDFGSGYANLNTVMQLPFSVIKLDRSLLFHICTDKNAALFYQSIVSAFCRLGYRIVAEGVETQEEMELLRSWNVDMIQGYYFSRPLPPDDLLRLLTGSAEMQAENQA